MVPVHPEDAEHYPVNRLYWLAPESRRSKLSHGHEFFVGAKRGRRTC